MRLVDSIHQYGFTVDNQLKFAEKVALVKGGLDRECLVSTLVLGSESRVTSPTTLYPRRRCPDASQLNPAACTIQVTGQA